MSDLLDGIGTAATGGLFARALEPESGAKKPHPEQPETCLNCGEELTGAYCHACGQKGHLHRTIGAFIHDLLHGALHFEGKLWRTLPVLAFRPGRLTRRYIDGERARFVSPMALFLFGVFLMFAVFQMIGITAPSDLDPAGAVETEVSNAREQAEAQLVELNAELEGMDADDPEREELESQITAIELLLAAQAGGGEAAFESVIAGIEGASDGETGGAIGYPDSAIEDPARAVVPLNEEGTVSVSQSPSGVEWLDNALNKWRDNPNLMVYKLQANAYKFSWLLIPISIPFVWLLFFWKRRFKAYDHAIFVTYSLSFMTLLFVTASLMGAAGAHPALYVIPLLLIPPIHLYKQLRGTYSLSRFSAFWRLMVLSSFIWIVVGLFLQVLFLLGAF